MWVEQWNDGIVIYGRIDGKRNNWARFPLEMDRRAHLGLWLAVADHVELPPVGWGDQFGYQSCKSYDLDTGSARVESCESWSKRQERYREQLRRLFVRHWYLAPETTTEVYATEAYRNVLAFANDSESPAFEQLKPSANPYVLASNSTGFWTFQLFVRWSDFPPSPDLTPSHIYLVLESYPENGSLSTTAPAREGGDPTTFNKLSFDQPPIFRLTECDSKLQGSDPYGKSHPGWFLPSSRATSPISFILANDVAGYRYTPAGLSPLPMWTHHYSKAVGAREFVCGPHLRYQAGGVGFNSLFSVEKKDFAGRSLPDGSYLVRSGPPSRHSQQIWKWSVWSLPHGQARPVPY